MKLRDEYGINGCGIIVLGLLALPVMTAGIWGLAMLATWATGPSEGELRAQHAAWVKLYSRPDITFEEWQRLDAAYLLPGGDIKRAREASDAAAASAAAASAAASSSAASSVRR